MMKKALLVISILCVMCSVVFMASGCGVVVEETKWYVQNVKEKGLYTASLEFTENAVLIGGAAAIVAPEIGLILGLYAVDDVSKMDTKEVILTVGNVAGFAAGTVLILAPAAAISAVGLATQGLPDNYNGGMFDALQSTLGDACHRDFDCVGSVCDEGVCRLPIDAGSCSSADYGAYDDHCLEYKTPVADPKVPSCVLDVDCANGLCLDGVCAPEIDCESRSDCPMESHACLNGICLLYNECAIDEACVNRGSGYCNAEFECVHKLDCVKSSDCAGNSICYQDVCIDCRFNSECGGDLLCFNGRCVSSGAVPEFARRQ